MGPDWLRRADTEELPRACKTLTNALIKAAGGVMRRPGTSELAYLQGDARSFVFQGRSATEVLVFTNTRLDVYDTSGTLLASITGCPWATADLSALNFTADSDQVFVFHTSFMPQVLTRVSSSSWTRAAYAFAAGVGNGTAQPFYDRFVDIDVTMTVTGGTGSQTVTFSDDVLKTDGSHVGARFRYLTKCEMEITAVASATSCTVTIHDTLYPTLNVTVGSSAGYKVGHVVEGSISQVRGIVTAIPNGTTVSVTLLEGYEQYRVITTSGVDKDRLVGPEAHQEITGVATTSYATTSIWDEQLVSDARDYPSTGLVHRGRLFMAGFPQATNLICASAVNNYYDFTVGAEDDEAIQEELGDDPNTTIRHLVSAEQLVLFTDRGSYYVPESGDNPITPTSIAFLRIGPEGAASPQPVIASEGILFIDEDAGRLMAAVPTGSIRRSWNTVELSEYGYHLLTSPVRIAVANGLDGRTERYVFILNSDGTFAVMVYRRGSEGVGFAKWERGTGTWSDITSIEDDVFVVSNISSGYRLGRFEFDSLTDDEVSYASTVSNRDGEDSDLVKNKCVVLTETVASGAVPSQAPAAGYSLGFDFAVTIVPASPIDGDSGWRRMRIPRSTVEVYQSGALKVNSRTSWPFSASDDLENVGAVTDRVIRAFSLGWSTAPAVTISQAKGAGALLEVRAVTMEVTQ